MTHAGTAMLDPSLILGKLNLKPGERLADFGCGRTGHFIFQASKLVGDNGAVYAVDILKDILQSISSRARSEGYDNILTVWSDIERLGYTPIAESSLDAVFIINVLNNIKDRSTTLLEAERLLKPGGKLMVVDWARKLGTLGPEEVVRVKPAELELLAKTAGFQSLDEFAAGPYHFGMLLTKT